MICGLSNLVLTEDAGGALAQAVQGAHDGDWSQGTAIHGDYAEPAPISQGGGQVRRGPDARTGLLDREGSERVCFEIQRAYNCCHSGTNWRLTKGQEEALAYAD